MIDEEIDAYADRDIDFDDLRSDFDEIKGLGSPSIDSYTMKEILLEF